MDSHFFCYADALLVNTSCLISVVKEAFMSTRVNCPCPEQGRNLNSQLSSAIIPPALPTEPDDHDQTIHRVLVNGLIVILRFYG